MLNLNPVGKQLVLLRLGRVGLYTACLEIRFVAFRRFCSDCCRSFPPRNMEYVREGVKGHDRADVVGDRDRHHWLRSLSAG